MRAVDLVESDPGADVLVVTNLWPEPARPAYGVFVQRQVSSLRAAGARCDVVYIRGFATPRAYVEGAWRLGLATFRGRRYRVVHAHAGETALAARFHLGAPMVVSYQGDDLLGDRDAAGNIPPVWRVRSQIVRWHSQLFDATITKTRAMEAVLPPRARRRNHVVPNGVDRELFAPGDREGARRELGWDDGRVALFVATKPRSPRKRLALAEAACAAAEVRLHVADDVDPASMPTLMRAADCLVLTSSLEGSPNAVKEALMCNLPVVSTRVGDVEELLAGVEPSWLCEPTEESFTAALRECIADGRRSNGREVAAYLDEGRIADRILRIYDEVGR